MIGSLTSGAAFRRGSAETNRDTRRCGHPAVRRSDLGAEFPGFGLLLASDRERALEVCLHQGLATSVQKISELTVVGMFFDAARALGRRPRRAVLPRSPRGPPSARP